MKISQVCAVALLLLACSMMAFADGINDPKIIIKGAGAEVKGPCPDCQGVGFNFKFTIPAGGSGEVFFTNESGTNWTSLKLIEKGVPAADIQCHSALFSSCTTETLKNGSVEILLSGAQGGAQWKDHGIPNGFSFAIDFSCVQKSCWPGGLNFNAHGSGATVPEPGTTALIVTGLGAIFSRRKAWKNRFNA